MPGETRTPNLLIRSQTLYPIELRAQIYKLHVEVKRCGAEDRNRTGTVVTYRRILSPVRLPVPPPRPKWPFNGADDETRTRDPNLGKVVLYQLSYVRIKQWCG